MIWGIMAVIMLTLLCLKLVSRKLKWHKAERFLQKIHNPCGFLLLTVIVIHYVATLEVWSTRSVMVIGSGILTAVLVLIMTFGYSFRRKLKSRWILLHRLVALFIVLLSICHLSFYYVDFFTYKNTID